jgi:hypothetical protein
MASVASQANVSGHMTPMLHGSCHCRANLECDGVEAQTLLPTNPEETAAPSTVPKRSEVYKFLSLFACLLVLCLSNASLADDFCTDLKSVISRSAKLKDLAGNQKRNYMWDATRSVSGFSLCRILRLPDESIVFSCDLQKQK